jgi:hypothetical protein
MPHLGGGYQLKRRRKKGEKAKKEESKWIIHVAKWGKIR